ncbi:MAG: helix-turn-helix domain-containing protein [Bacilli bacterium]|nr:helix-turn-helix domain-containing protein [Bacilli bacterium]
MDYKAVIRKALSGLMSYYTVKEIADILHVNKGNVYRWFNCETSPAGETMFQICALYEEKTGRSIRDLY